MAWQHNLSNQIWNINFINGCSSYMQSQRGYDLEVLGISVQFSSAVRIQYVYGQVSESSKGKMAVRLKL